MGPVGVGIADARHHRHLPLRVQRGERRGHRMPAEGWVLTERRAPPGRKREGRAESRVARVVGLLRREDVEAVGAPLEEYRKEHRVVGGRRRCAGDAVVVRVPPEIGCAVDGQRDARRCATRTNAVEGRSRPAAAGRPRSGQPGARPCRGGGRLVHQPRPRELGAAAGVVHGHRVHEPKADAVIRPGSAGQTGRLSALPRLLAPIADRYCRPSKRPTMSPAWRTNAAGSKIASRPSSGAAVASSSRNGVSSSQARCAFSWTIR